MERLKVHARESNVSSPKLDDIVGEMGAVVLINRFQESPAARW